MSCTITYRGREMSEEAFQRLTMNEKIPEINFLRKVKENPIGYIFNKQDKVFYKEEPNGSFTKKSF